MASKASRYKDERRGAWGMKPRERHRDPAVDRPRVRVLSGSDAERGGWVTPPQKGLQRYDAVLDPHCTVFRTPAWEQHYRIMRLSEDEKNRWNERSQSFLPPLPNRAAATRIPVTASPHFDPLAPANAIKVYAPGISFPPLYHAVAAAGYGADGPVQSNARHSERRAAGMAMTYPASVKLAVAVAPDGTMSYSAYPVSDTPPADPYNPHVGVQPQAPPQSYYYPSTVMAAGRPKANAMGGTRHPATLAPSAPAGSRGPQGIPLVPAPGHRSESRGEVGRQAQAAVAVAAEQRRAEEAAAAAEEEAAQAAAAAASGARPMVVCGPSGVGKGTLIQRLMARHPDSFGFAVSHTTRGPRPGEEHGVHYYFAERGEMEAAIARGEFLESAHVHGNLYGTSFRAVREVLASGRACVLDIDVQGARQVRAAADRGALPRPLFVFIAPPSFAELETRLRGRGTETEEKIALRLKNARAEMDFAEQSEGFFDQTIVNDEVQIAYAELEALASSLVRGGGEGEPAAAPAEADAEAGAAPEAEAAPEPEAEAEAEAAAKAAPEAEAEAAMEAAPGAEAEAAPEAAPEALEAEAEAAPAPEAEAALEAAPDAEAEAGPEAEAAPELGTEAPEAEAEVEAAPEATEAKAAPVAAPEAEAGAEGEAEAEAEAAPGEAPEAEAAAEGGAEGPSGADAPPPEGPAEAAAPADEPEVGDPAAGPGPIDVPLVAPAAGPLSHLNPPQKPRNAIVYR
eukprot:tig00000076_g2338.t1